MKTRKQRLRATRLATRKWRAQLGYDQRTMREQPWVKRSYVCVDVESTHNPEMMGQWLSASNPAFPGLMEKLKQLRCWDSPKNEHAQGVMDRERPHILQSKMVQGGTAVVRGNPGPFLQYVGCDWAKSVSRTGRAIFQKQRTDADDAMKYALMAAKLAPTTFKEAKD